MTQRDQQRSKLMARTIQEEEGPMPTRTHTETPWTYDKSHYVRTVDHTTYIAEVLFGPDCPDADESNANAALIVRAVNSHAALVEACEAALYYIRLPFNDAAQLDQTVFDLKAALALARQEGRR